MDSRWEDSTWLGRNPVTRVSSNAHKAGSAHLLHHPSEQKAAQNISETIVSLVHKNHLLIKQIRKLKQSLKEVSDELQNYLLGRLRDFKGLGLRIQRQIFQQICSFCRNKSEGISAIHQILVKLITSRKQQSQISIHQQRAGK